MKQWILMAILAGGFLLNAGADENVRRAELADSVLAFACDLYQKAAAGDENCFFSPYSLEAALSMTLLGAQGETAKQMQNVLHATENQKALAEIWAIERKYQKSKSDIFSSVNALWIQEGMVLDRSFSARVQKGFGAALNRADFIKNADAVRLEINSWVEQQTHGLIKDLIPQGVLDALTRMVLCNAVHFKAVWEEEFDPKKTSKGPFFGNAGETTAKFMTKKETFAFAETEYWKALRLPYKGKGVAMLVILPAEQQGLQSFGAELSPGLIGEIRDTLQRHEVDVKIPKFTMEDSFTLSTALRAMGMPLAFSQHADFSGMTAAAQLAISEVIHKAFIEVDEEGTEAAAATAVVMRMTAMRPDPEPKTFYANRPFLFIIEDLETGMPYFMGRVMMPGK